MKRVLVSLVVLLAGAACTLVAPVKPPFRYVEAARPQRVWITRTDGSELVVGAPRLVGDTLFGFEGVKFHEIPLASIHQLRAAKSAPVRTAGLAIGVSVAFVAAYFGLLKQPSAGGPKESNCLGDEEAIC